MGVELVVHTGWWSLYPTLPGGAGTRYPRYQLIQLLPGDANKKPFRGNASVDGELIFDYVWVNRLLVDDGLGRPLALCKYDYVRASDATIVDALGVEVDISKRQHVHTGLGLEGRWRMYHDGKEILTRNGQAEHDALMDFGR